MPDLQANQPARRRLPAELTRAGSRLLHAQCWAWGQDVKRPEGNLLLEYGFDRVRPPAGLTGCSQYSFEIAHGLIVRLWGFGVYIGRSEGMYLNRFDFVPRHAALMDQWTPAQLSRGRRHVDASLLLALTGWLAEYEQWVESIAGTGYRRSTFTSWSTAEEHAIDLAVDWLALKSSLAAYFTPAQAGCRAESTAAPGSAYCECSTI